MNDMTVKKRPRGRPPKTRADAGETRDALLNAGVAVLTEKAFSATGIDEVLRSVSVPKGSFYHYFASKEEFGLQIIERYADYFVRKLRSHFAHSELAPLKRVRNFVEDAKAGMAKYEFRRGCLIGNLGQEMGSLPESFRIELSRVFESWQDELRKVLDEAQSRGEIYADLDTAELAEYFWIGWEGAVLRAKLERSTAPLNRFVDLFFRGIEPHADKKSH